MGNGEGGNECECCGCTILADKLFGARVPSFLTTVSGSWTPTDTGLRTTSTGAKLMLPDVPIDPAYSGVQFSIDVANASAGDVAVISFNDGWEGRWVCDDGTGTTGYFGLFDGGGSLINRIPATMTGSTGLALCIARNVTNGSYSGDVVVFQGLGYPITLSTLAVGFGTGSPNAGGLKFTNGVLAKSNPTGDDPFGCGGCDCSNFPPLRGTWAQITGLTVKLTIDGIEDNTDDHPENCGDCPKQNGSYTMTYLPGPDPNSAYTGQYHVDVDLGPSCLDDDSEVAGQVDAVISGGGCGNSFLAVSGLIIDAFSTPAPIDVGVLDAASLGSANSAISATPDYMSGDSPMPEGTPQCNPSPLVSPTNLSLELV